MSNECAKDVYKELRREAARSCWLSRRNNRVKLSELGQWYEGRYLAYKQSAALLEIALRHDEWRAANDC